MNIQDLAKMEAGLEIDNVLAELMEWKKIKTGLDYDPSMGIVYVVQSDGIWKFQPGIAYLWQPSRLVRDAWELVDKPSNFEFRLQEYKLFSGSIFWQAEFHEPGSIPHMVRANTAALAICRAFLLASAPV